jgi:hypothetical protein
MLGRGHEDMGEEHTYSEERSGGLDHELIRWIRDCRRR